MNSPSAKRKRANNNKKASPMKRRRANNQNTAARKIQAAYRRRPLRVPRNRVNNVVQIPLNTKHVVQFKEGQNQRLVAPNTMKYMRKSNGTFVSALSKQPIKNFRVRRVQYYNVAKNKNKEARNKKNIENKIKNLSKKQSNMRKGKALLNPIVHMNQTNQNAQVARQLQEQFNRQAAANTQRVRNNATALGFQTGDVMMAARAQRNRNRATARVQQNRNRAAARAQNEADFLVAHRAERARREAREQHAREQPRIVRNARYNQFHRVGQNDFNYLVSLIRGERRASPFGNWTQLVIQKKHKHDQNNQTNREILNHLVRYVNRVRSENLDRQHANANRRQENARRRYLQTRSNENLTALHVAERDQNELWRRMFNML